jgi:hypothetical protein
MMKIGVLFKKADMNEMGNITRRNMDQVLPFRRCKKAFASLESSPDCVIPLLEKPATTSSLFTIPLTKKIMSAEKRISPGCINYFTNAAIMITMIEITISPCDVIKPIIIQ